MAIKLTKIQRADAEQRRISQLTNQHDAHFKVILSHQLEKKYCFSGLHNPKRARKLKNKELIKVFKEFGKFLDDSVRLTITEVENKYKRPSDPSDGTFDPEETSAKVQVEHFCLYEDGAPPNGAPDSVRVHGYFRTNGGYFVVTRLDWFHEVHRSG